MSIKVNLCITKDSFSRILLFTDIVTNHKAYYPDRDLPTCDFAIDLDISFEQFSELLCKHNIPFILDEHSSEGKKLRTTTCLMFLNGVCHIVRKEDVTPFFWDDQISRLRHLGIEENLE